MRYYSFLTTGVLTSIPASGRASLALNLSPSWPLKPGTKIRIVNASVQVGSNETAGNLVVDTAAVAIVFLDPTLAANGGIDLAFWPGPVGQRPGGTSDNSNLGIAQIQPVEFEAPITGPTGTPVVFFQGTAAVTVRNTDGAAAHSAQLFGKITFAED